MTRAWPNRLMLFAPAAVVGLLALHVPADDGPTYCPFALATGTACPGCGMTRAAAYLIRGDWTTAVGYHPLVPMVAALSIAGWLWYLLRRSGRVAPLPAKWVSVTLIGVGLMFLGVWAVRLATGTLPPV